MVKGKKAIADFVRKISLEYPEAFEDHPWDHDTYKVRKKTFVFVGGTDETMTLTVKLPLSREEALTLSNAEPSRYGLGKSGWITFAVDHKTRMNAADIEEWIDESYRAVAPKTLVKHLPSIG
jgi:predicted DNA-binding protein (MmcQ/YjbR family)